MRAIPEVAANSTAVCTMHAFDSYRPCINASQSSQDKHPNIQFKTILFDLPNYILLNFAQTRTGTVYDIPPPYWTPIHFRDKPSAVP
jgi:hypothetical protein